MPVRSIFLGTLRCLSGARLSVCQTTASPTRFPPSGRLFVLPLAIALPPLFSFRGIVPTLSICGRAFHYSLSLSFLLFVLSPLPPPLSPSSLLSPPSPLPLFPLLSFLLPPLSRRPLASRRSALSVTQTRLHMQGSRYTDYNSSMKELLQARHARLSSRLPCM